MSKMMKRLPVNLKDKQHEAIRKIAFKDNKSMSDIIRIAVDEYIDKRKNGKRTS
jgi:metal-responsive CopG/Arc/MetJ family transcriptional regulator